MSTETTAETLTDMVYECMEGCEDVMAYHNRHGTPSLLILTQHNPKIARYTAGLLAEHIRGKVVIEVGAGIGFLALELARYAKRYIGVEVDPAWSWVFTKSLYRHKPPNLSWFFGCASEAAKAGLRGDVALVFTHSGEEQMRGAAGLLCPQVFLPFEWPVFAELERKPLLELTQYIEACVAPSPTKEPRA